MSDDYDDGFRSPAPALMESDHTAQRRESRRMMALDCAVRCQKEFSTTGDVAAAACLFLAFLEAGA